MNLLDKDLVVYVKTTATCNLNCAHCFTNGNLGPKIYFNPVFTASYLRNIYEQNQLNSMRLLYHGGEPLITPMEDLMTFYKLTKQHIPNVDYGIQTNLVYKLNSSRMKFFEEVFDGHGIGTSWDPDIRFGSAVSSRKEDDEKLWRENVKKLTSEGNSLTLMVCISKYLVANYEPSEIIEMAIDLGFEYILFERITSDGSATMNTDIFVDNYALDAWFIRMYEQTMKNKYYEKIGNAFLEEIATAYLKNNHVANRCRGCEQKLLTINADGTIAGCPNSATAETWSQLKEGPDAFINSPGRIEAICTEKMRNTNCLTCEVNDLCNGDCYKLPWQGDRCAAPKGLFKLLRAEDNRQEYQRLLM